MLALKVPHPRKPRSPRQNRMGGHPNSGWLNRMGLSSRLSLWLGCSLWWIGCTLSRLWPRHPHQIFFLSLEIPVNQTPSRRSQEGLLGLVVPPDFCSQALEPRRAKPGEWPSSGTLTMPGLIRTGRVPGTSSPAGVSGPGPPHRAPQAPAASASNKEPGPWSLGGHQAGSEDLRREISLSRECFGSFLPSHNFLGLEVSPLLMRCHWSCVQDRPGRRTGRQSSQTDSTLGGASPAWTPPV